MLTFGELLCDFCYEEAFGPKGLSPLSLLLARSVCDPAADLTLLIRLTLELVFSLVIFFLIIRKLPPYLTLAV